MEFFNQAIDILKILVMALGAGLAVWGVINLLEGYGSDNQWEEIADYMSLLIKGGGKLVYDEDNAIEVPKDETPAYLEWTLWKAALAISERLYRFCTR